MINISLVTPVYSGEKYLTRLVDEIAAVKRELSAASAPYAVMELILVDDASIDDSAHIIDKLSRSHEWVKALHLSRNSGQHAATTAGILYTSGEWVVTLDEDLQHPPRRIRTLLVKAISTGSDIVYGHPATRVHQSPFRDLTSHSYKYLIAWLTNSPNVKHFNSFRLIRGSIAREAARIASHDMFLDVALGWYSQRIATATMEIKDERYIQTSASGYRLKSLLSHARRMIMSGQTKFLRVAGYLGLVAALLSAAFAIFILIYKIIHPEAFDAQGWASIVLLISFFSGAILFMLAVIMEYISLLAANTRGRPLFFIVDRSIDKPLREFFAEHFEGDDSGEPK